MRHDEIHCCYWSHGVRATYDEPGEPAGCTDPRHCAEHWQELVRYVPAKESPEVECPVCHKSKRMSIGGYVFDNVEDEIVAAPGAMCADCEMTIEEEQHV